MYDDDDDVNNKDRKSRERNNQANNGSGNHGSESDRTKKIDVVRASKKNGRR